MSLRFYYDRKVDGKATVLDSLLKKECPIDSIKE